MPHLLGNGGNIGTSENAVAPPAKRVRQAQRLDSSCDFCGWALDRMTSRDHMSTDTEAMKSAWVHSITQREVIEQGLIAALELFRVVIDR
ncbi:hypothetical protein N7524_001309 [Penicillium chrysogenum]|nr:hypothetical protein N7524_001309 [Penicillium chrysogenum]